MINLYKFINEDNTVILKYPETYISKDGNGWNEYLEYVAEGGLTDPFRTHDELVENALSLLWIKKDNIIKLNVPLDSNSMKDSKLTKALRKETKGNANTNDIELLNNNDILDDWFDEMEIAAESDNFGEQWIEDPERTDQELIDYNPALVPWPEYPL